MSVKIELSFLSNKSKMAILTKTLRILFSSGFNYRGYVDGEYTYWLDAPIFKFGKSETIKEPKGEPINTARAFRSVIKNAANHYSPTIKLGAVWTGNAFSAFLSIFEFETNWKEVQLSFDRFELYDSLEKEERRCANENIFNIFRQIALKIGPYYGVAALEMAGLVDSPDKLKINRTTLGDFNYLSTSLAARNNIADLKDGYLIKKQLGKGIFIYKIDGAFGFTDLTE